jgi:hypothetical protein
MTEGLNATFFANALIAVTNISPFFLERLHFSTRYKVQGPFALRTLRSLFDRHISLQGYYCICLVYRVIGWTVDWGVSNCLTLAVSLYSPSRAVNQGGANQFRNFFKDDAHS